MFGRKIPLFKLFGFQINIDPSWFIIAILITWSLATGYFPNVHEELATSTYWIMGVAGAIGLFVSIVLHELGHSLVARRCGMEMRGITLFIFGGVAEMSQEPPSAQAEFFVAIAGPIVSVAIGGGLLVVAGLQGALGLPEAVGGVIAYLAFINLILVAFNMIPAFPLDGGRVLRAALWHARSDLRWATRVTSMIGSGFGLVLMGLGVVSFISGQFIGGVWWFVLGMFLQGAARMSYQQALLRQALEGESARAFMRSNVVTVEPEQTLEDVVQNFVYRHQHKLYPVVENGRLVGCVTIGRIKEVSRDAWGATRVRDVMDGCTEDNTIAPDVDAMQALAKLNRTGSSRLMVVEGDRLAGVLSLKDLMGFLAMKIDLEGE